MLAEVGYQITVWVSSHVSRGGLSDKSRSKYTTYQLLVLKELCKFVQNLSGGGSQTLG